MTRRKLPKQLLVHGLILGSFLFYCVFLAEPLFNKFERIPGESKRHIFALPRETGGIRYNIEKLETAAEAIELKGWAFLEKPRYKSGRVYVVLQSKRHTYIFDTYHQPRPDVAKYFESAEVEGSGFFAIIPKGKIRRGRYKVGLYLETDNTRALIFTRKSVVTF